MGVHHLLEMLRMQPAGAENLDRIPPVSLRKAGCLWAKFNGPRYREGPLTVSQKMILQRLLDKSSDHWYYRMPEWVLELPGEVALDGIVATFGALLSRYESLRTTYVVGDEPVQRVARSGELAIDVYEIEDQHEDTLAVARELTQRLRAREFDLAGEWPLRVAVAVSGGVPFVAAVVFSHLAVDFTGMSIVGREFTRLAADPARREEPGPFHQPLDQAEADRSARGQRRAAAAARYWRHCLRYRPQCLHPVPPGAPPGPGGPLSGWLWSPAAALALPHVAERVGATRQMVVLAAVCAVLGRRAGHDRCVFSMLANNRYERQLRDYVGTQVQETLLSIDTEAASFDELVRRAGAATLTASLNAQIDRQDLLRIIDEVHYRRGIFYRRDCVFNDLSPAALIDPLVTGLPHPESPGDPAAAACAVGRTTLRWVEWAENPGLLLFNLLRVDREVVFGISTADTRHVPRHEMELMLRGVESLLVAAATADIALDDLGEITGVDPVRRGPDWLRVDSCWISLAEARRLASDALPSASLVVPDARRGRGLVAYTAAGWGVETPQQAHAACMAVLPGRYTAMAPSHYVICDRAPGDALAPEAWERQIVLVEGDGR
jgi:Condensation domain